MVFLAGGKTSFSMFSTIVLFFLSSALNDSVSGGDCIAVSGPGKGKACVFPFKARGKEYTQCTKDGGFDNFWCSTKVSKFINFLTPSKIGNYLILGGLERQHSTRQLWRLSYE